MLILKEVEGWVVRGSLMSKEGRCCGRVLGKGKMRKWMFRPWGQESQGAGHTLMVPACDRGFLSTEREETPLFSEQICSLTTRGCWRKSSGVEAWHILWLLRF